MKVYPSCSSRRWIIRRYYRYSKPGRIAAEKIIDFNCDLGESFGTYKLGLDEQLMPYISSANIACGFHAGDPVWIGRTVSLTEKLCYYVIINPLEFQASQWIKGCSGG